MFAALKRRFLGDPKEELAKVLGDAPLPTFPKVASHALDKLRLPQTSLREVGLILQGDPGLSVTLLKTVNSAAFGLRSPCKNVPHAASLLGRTQLEAMVLAIAVRRCSPKRAPGLNSRRFWHTAAKRAAIARNIAAAISPRLAAEAFTAGLLQDLAVPLLAQRKDSYAEVLGAWHGREGDLDALEQQVFGWSHAEIGALLAKQWTFPEPLLAAIGDHHGADAEPSVGVVSLLHETVDNHDEIIELAHSRFALAHDTVAQAITQGTLDAQELSALWK